MKEKDDIVMIGAGVIGCAVASKLSAYKARIAVLESAHDLACGASKANSGIVHGGFDALPGTKKAVFNVLGCALTEWESKRLDFPYRKNGSMVLAFDKEEEKTLHTLMERGIKNRVPGLSIISGEQARGLESGISEKVTAALLCTSAGIVSPYEETLAYAENACVNGAEFFFDTRVTGVTGRDKEMSVRTANGEIYTARAVINCAGVHADEICAAYEGRDKEKMPRFEK